MRVSLVERNEVALHALGHIQPFLLTGVGGQTVATCSAFDINANDFGNMRATLNVYQAPGAGVTVIVQGQGGWTTAGAPLGNNGADAVFATNAALTVDVQITYGSASAGNTSVLSSLVVLIN